MLLANAAVALQLWDGTGGWWQLLVPMCHLWDITPYVLPICRAEPPLLSIITHCHSLCYVTQQNSPGSYFEPS